MMSNDLNTPCFDGEQYSELLVAIILISLFFFGSNNIKDLSAAPTQP